MGKRRGPGRVAALQPSGRKEAILNSNDYPSARRGWMLVGILVAAYAMSFVDRQILSLLVEDLRRDLAISDSQIGLLQGPAFGVFYAVMGLPFGWLADGYNRMRIIAAGLLLWTLATVMGGLAESFGPLLVSRMLVGVGEAALVPAAVSLLSDSFPPQRRALPLAIFTAGVSLGAGLALVLGGALVALARDGVEALPLIGAWLAAKQPWQAVLVMAGLGGVPLALLILCLPEPVRRRERDAGDDTGLWALLRREWRLFVPLLGGSALLYLFSNALSGWMPSLFIREFGWQPAMVGLRMGSLILVCALAGNVLSGALATRLVGGGQANGTLKVMAGGAALMAPVAILAPLAPAALAAQAGLALVYLSMSLCFGVATASFVAVTPGPLRGRMVALYLLTGNLVGLGLGPPAVALALERIVGDPGEVGVALAIVAACSALPGALLLRFALAPHARAARA